MDIEIFFVIKRPVGRVSSQLFRSYPGLPGFSHIVHPDLLAVKAVGEERIVPE